MTFAIIKTGGKQYKVSEGDVVTIEKLAEAPKGNKVIFDEVLLVDREGEVKIGTPMVSDAKVSAEVVDEGLGKKVSVIHYKAKVRHTKIGGHRQPFTKVRIESIG
jgi:large subunit ribosomal protein L21